MGQEASRPGPRTTEMRVLGLGMSRTGTSTFAKACSILLDDAPVYHGGSQYLSPFSGQLARWIEIGRYYPFRKTQPTVADKAKIKYLMADAFEGYAATADSPACWFAEEMMELYPDATVVVTTREREKWWKSIEPVIKNSTVPGLGWILWPVPGMRHWETMRWTYESGRYAELYYGRGLDGPGIHVYDRHMEYLERVVPRDKLHYYSVKDGWEPLCAILGLPVPDVPFPHENDAEMVQKAFERNMKLAAVMWVGILGAVAVSVNAAIRLRR
ncbi:hypothetical protein K490DRAFT_57377 [Saccharata proteae CBS 121410]|uniref:P-loop containing nucleoside triphosphate hydrolase protein n=1 Tax=Saccharata proteae CBS 121410 TaxID=1314787 RepID=A0A9P4LZG6_9PEZI|nr:hypothetical protein K490DRAFT_57377 [Saccharata proteae CBS 121410]